MLDLKECTIVSNNIFSGMVGIDALAFGNTNVLGQKLANLLL